ncbi:MAG: hypothetical protein FWC24_06720, partial [Treponema sp.]|nr:hypothetical protein [Treponema sp.]
MTDTRKVDAKKKSRTASTETIAQAENKAKAVATGKAEAVTRKAPAATDPEPVKQQAKTPVKQKKPAAAAVEPKTSPAKTAAGAAETAPAGAETAVTKTDNTGSPLTDPAVLKLIEYAKEKKTLSFEELSDYLPDYISDTEKIEPVLALLESNNVQIIVDDNPSEEEADAENTKSAETRKKQAASGDKESSLVDDPIRMYLREIGRENLLTAEQEIELSRQMEEGENIIKNVIKKSGMIIPEFYHIADEAFSKKDLRELSLSKKETTERMAERRRLNSFYKDSLRTILGDLKNYIELKQRLIDRGAEYSEDKELAILRRRGTR